MSCNSQKPEDQELILNIKDKTVDLSESLKEAWDEVCIFSPYSNNQTAEDTLGFEWDLETHTSIYTNDGVSLLVFVRNRSVFKYFEVSRRVLDFTSLGSHCFKNKKSSFIIKNGNAIYVEI